MKFKSIGLILLGFGFLFMSSCSSTPESVKTIPNETDVISVIDIYSIIQKGKLDEISDFKFFKTFKKEIRNENKKIAKILDNVIEDPAISGIKFTSDLFFYYVNDSDDEQFMCLSAEIDSEEKFAEFVEDVLDKSDVEFDIEDEKDYKYTLIGNESAIAWDDDKMVLIIASTYASRENLDVEIETLMTLKDKDLITENDEFNDFYKEKKDISVWFSTNLFEDFREFTQLEKETDFDLADNYISTYLSFEDDKISLLTKFSANEEIQKIIDENNIWDNDFNADLLDLFPEKSYAVASLSLSPMAYYSILENEDSFDKVEKEFKKETELDLKKVFESLNGNMVYSLFGFENMEYTYKAWGYGFNPDAATLLEKKYKISEAGYLSQDEKTSLSNGETIVCQKFSRKYCISIKNILDNGGTLETAIKNDSEIVWYEGGWEFGQNIETTVKEYLPLMGFAFDLNNKKIIDKLMKKIPEDEIQKRSNYYEFKFDNKYPTYFAFNEKMCFVTNDLKSIKEFKNGGFSSDNLGDSDVKSNITSSSFFTYLNLDYGSYPKTLKKEIEDNQNEKEAKMFKIWDGFAKSIELKQIDKTSFEIVFNLKDIDNNSLNYIISTVDDNYKDFM